MQSQTNSIQEELTAMFVNRDSLKKRKERMTGVVEQLEREVRLISEDKAEIDSTWQALRKLLDMFSTESIGLLKEMLVKGLKAVFTDRDYSIHFEVTDTKNKKLKMLLTETKPDGDKTEINLMSKQLLSGGGLLSVASFIFQVYLIVLYGKRRFIAVDEKFGNISQGYIENFMQFIKYLHKDLGFDFLIINHDPRMADHMDRVYRVNMGDVKLVNSHKDETVQRNS